jgi:hypothetical protein
MTWRGELHKQSRAILRLVQYSMSHIRADVIKVIPQ